MGISHNAISPDEVKSAKLLLGKGNLSMAEIGTVINRSKTTVKRIADGGYDYLISPKAQEEQIANEKTPNDKIIDALDKLISLNCELNAKLDVLLSVLEDSKDEPKPCETKIQTRLGKPFLRWNDVTRRVACYGGNEIAKQMDKVEATLDNTTLHLYCKQDTKAYLQASRSAINLIKQHTKNTIGYSVDVVLEDS